MENTLREIINYAIWAPSGDNTQPWHFKIVDNVVEVYIYPNKDNPILNFELSGTYISAGAVIENLKIAATHYGLSVEVKLFPDTAKNDFVAKIYFKQDKILEDSLFPFIKDRCTNRNKYKEEPISNDLKIALMDVNTNQYIGASLSIVNDVNKIKEIASLCSLTEKIALETPAIHKLFFESLVWSRNEEKEKGMGLYVNTLGLPKPILLLFKIVKNWKITSLLNKIGFSKIAAKGNAETYSRSGALCSIYITKPDSVSFVNAGMLMERFWLKATSLGLSVQPVTGILFFIMYLRAGKIENFLPKHLPDIQNAYEKIYKAYGIGSETICMHLRIGFGKKPYARSLRNTPLVETVH